MANSRLFLADKVKDWTILLILEHAPLDVRTGCESEFEHAFSQAQENGAEYIISGDRDLLDWSPQLVPIVSPAGFETILAAIQKW